ncbi:isoprenylcysteine carboxyl methyltransferase family protein [Evansella tamaricis]|uniref:Isoprenylcysteine carboxyl methyltransferase n=1 Tax=Evansella tamaricis TaxID=2069301 RepID=A0ABS6JE14_9BACI|nr:isoprenylcysteine carboxylmethyltransferase family protein [Evansella tamaricis]MBU9710690.1 hypothetical protein [Evansella tamaricis]
MTLFFIILSILLIQRGLELVAAKRNEKWMVNRGGLEFGKGHYKWIVLLHAGFFFFLSMEVLVTGAEFHPLWPIVISILLTAQLARYWVLLSLGKFWNTKIIILPGETMVKKGPYQWVKHPNYLIVAVEILTIPLLFQAYYTAVIFSVLNSLLLIFVRIPKEEEALQFLLKGSD